MMDPPPPNIGILVDSPALVGWQSELIQGLAARTGAHVWVLVVTRDVASAHGRQGNSWWRASAERLLSRLEGPRMRRSRQLAEQFTLLESETQAFVRGGAEVPDDAPVVQEVHLERGDIDRISTLDLDLVIDLGAASERSAVAKFARQGMLWLSFDEEGSPGQAPIGFTAVVNRLPTTDFLVNWKDGVAEEARIVARGSVTTQTFFVRNRAHVVAVGARRLQDCAVGVLTRQCAPRVVDGPLRNLPPSQALSVVNVGRYLAQQVTRLARRLARRLQRRRGSWHVLVARKGWSEADLSRAVELPACHGTWIADPFVFHWRGRTHCMVEEFVSAEGRGRVALYDLTDGQGNRLGVALEEPFHLSYPFVFEYEGSLYMCPESAEARQIRVYRCEGSLLDWRLAGILMDGVSAVDSMLVPHSEGWLLLTNIDETGSGDFSTGLWAFRADSPLSATWVPDPCNPVVMGTASLRNGGIVRDGTAAYRVGQASDFDAYGTSVWLQRMEADSDGRYAETPVRHILPDFLPGIRGTHHLSSADGVTACDVYRE